MGGAFQASSSLGNIFQNFVYFWYSILMMNKRKAAQKILLIIFLCFKTNLKKWHRFTCIDLKITNINKKPIYIIVKIEKVSVRTSIRTSIWEPIFFSKLKPVSMRLCGARDFSAGAIGCNSIKIPFSFYIITFNFYVKNIKFRKKQYFTSKNFSSL